jgi:two-component system sensor histidine kinase TctE
LKKQKVHTRSLRRLLLGWLLIPLLVLLALGSVGTFFMARNAANDAYDKELLDPMLALAQYIRVIHGKPVLDLPASAQNLLLVDAYDNIYYQLIAADGTRLGGNLYLPIPAQISDKPLFYNTAFRGRNIRAATLKMHVNGGGSVYLQVAETLDKRDHHLVGILAEMLAPAVIIALAAVLLVWFGVRRGLAPLQSLQKEIAARSHRDLRPVPEHHAPDEVRPVVASLNALLARLNDSMNGQQRFLANAAHQLRTPLSGLQTQVELALRGTMTAELRATLTQLLDATVRTAHLANQLLTLARAEPGAMSPDAMQPLDLHKVVEDAAQEWVPRAMVRQIDLGFDIETTLLIGEPLLIRELLANLIDNALRYTPAGGSVTVRCRQANGAVLEVEDNGIGIPESQREKVLERFHRVEGSPGGGCGLGLAIVQEIARIHGATLEITAPPAGRGTLVCISFPQSNTFSNT